MAGRDAPNIPKMVLGTDLKSLPIGPLEGFLLTRMDGTLPVPALAEMVGQPEDEVRSAVERLVSLGAAEWADLPADDGASPEPTSVAFGEADTVPPPPSDADAEAPGPTAASTPPAAEAPPRYDPAELEEEVDLPLERRKRVLDTYYRLDELDHYALLGIPRDADKAAVRAAYFGLSKVFHPDTLYGRRLGSFKPKMERVFRQLTEAYETLGKQKRRQAYDEYLGLKDTTRAAQQAMEETDREARAIEQGSAAAGSPASSAV
ncbi:MAG: DnaJ domain-containing protein, partial [Myxococcota bacterium]